MTQRILVVDDDRQIVRLLRSYLEQAGYNVLTAYDGAAALQSIRRDRPDLAILDLMLPDHDGWEITRTARADPDTKDVPVILLSAKGRNVDQKVGFEVGADDYITKPFSPRKLVERINAILGHGTSQQRMQA